MYSIRAIKIAAIAELKINKLKVTIEIDNDIVM
jgi:hypothetical protein